MAASGGTKACRLCLIMDSEVISIDMQLENSMRSILGQNITYESGLPKYACNDCAEFLRRFKVFREKCLIAQTVLYQILKTAGQVTETEIRKLNRQRLKLDTQITPVQEKIPQEIPPTEERPEEIKPTDGIPVVDEPSGHQTVKMEPESLEMDTMEESESETDDKNNVTFEAFEEESDVLLDTRNPLEEENTTVKKEIKEELILPPENADLSEGFKICIPPIKSIKVEFETDESSVALYHCERCCKPARADQDQPDDCPQGVACPFEFGSLAEHRRHAAHHRTYACRRCSFSATHVETARKHRQQKHSDKIYVCCYCNHRNTEAASFVSHVRARHPLQLVCCACGSCFDSRPGLRAHTGRLHKRTPRDSSTSSSMATKKTDTVARSYAASKRYTQEELELAISLVKQNKLTLSKACQKFNIPKGTLHNKIRNKVPVLAKKGPRAILSPEEELIVVQLIIEKGSKYVLRVDDVRKVVKSYVDSAKHRLPVPKDYPGQKWIQLFLKRHPEIVKYMDFRRQPSQNVILV